MCTRDPPTAATLPEGTAAVDTHGCRRRDFSTRGRHKSTYLFMALAGRDELREPPYDLQAHIGTEPVVRHASTVELRVGDKVYSASPSNIRAWRSVRASGT